ncbi:MAG: alpha-(1-_3)-arabinofuranosyltransferase [Nostocoides sp.]
MSQEIQRAVPAPGSDASRAGTTSHPGAPDLSSAARWRLRRAVIMLLMTAFAFNSSPGLIAPDTKIDLTEDPWGFLGRAAHLWDRTGFAGQVQDQAFGYFFPMGPFFGIGHTLGLPGWVTGRAWWALVLCLAFAGMVRLLTRLGLTSPFGVTVGGLVYALSPHLLTVIGPVSAEIWPMAVAPWVLAPLVAIPPGGSLRRAASASGLAVFVMGAVNATAVIAAVAPAGLWLVTRPWSRRTAALLAWWVGCVVLATLWWVPALLILGRYSPLFLDHIENAGVVNTVTTLFETLRGTADWTAFLSAQGWLAGEMFLRLSAVIAATGAVVVLGLLGLARRTTLHRHFFIGLLLIGVAIFTVGYAGPVHGFFAEGARMQLDGVLAPFRNVHKVDLFIRMPIAVGVASLVGGLGWGRDAVERRIARAQLYVATVVVLAIAAAPLVVLRLAPSGSYVEVPSYWRQAAAWLQGHARDERALVVPGARFAYFQWGRPKDEPLQPLASTQWEVRDAVPMVDPGHIRMLDAIEAQFAAGQPSDGLADYLQQNGIDVLVVRNDLNYVDAGAPRPAQVHAVLERSAGISRVTQFGPTVGAVELNGVAVDQGLQQSYPAVEIFAVNGSVGIPEVSLVPESGLVELSGGPESGLAVATAGARPLPATVLSGDLAQVAPSERPAVAATVVTDSLRRRDVTFGRNTGAVSATMTANESPRVDKAVRDYLPMWASGRETVAEYAGIASVSASTSASDASAALISVPGDQPWAALDGDAATAWRTAPLTNPTDQWLQVQLDRPTSVAYVDLQLTMDAVVKAVDIETDRLRQRVRLTRQGSSTRIELPEDGPITRLRVSFPAVQSDHLSSQQVGVVSLDLAGIAPERYLRVPEGPTQVEAFVFGAEPSADACLHLLDQPVCAVGLAHASEDAAGIYRVFDVPQNHTYGVSGTVVPRPSAQLDQLLEAALEADARVAVSSRAVPDPIAGPLSLTDADPRTAWVAAATDRDPTITVEFPKTTSVSRISIDPAPAYAATTPTSMTISNGTFSQEVDLTGSTTVEITPVAGQRISVTLHADRQRVSLGGTSAIATPLGIGIAGLTMTGLTSTPRYTSDARTVEVPCGEGPQVVIDGISRDTSVRASVKQLRELQPIPLSLCSGLGTAALSRGEHRLRAPSSSLWQVRSVRLADLRRLAAIADEQPVGIKDWTAVSGRIELPERAEDAVLVVRENANAGWEAELDGKRLSTVTINGWQQGYLVPAGAAGVVTLRYAPDGPYRMGLVAGLLALVVLFALALAPARRPSALTGPAGRPLPTGILGVVLAGVLAGAGGWYGFGVAVVAAGAVWFGRRHVDLAWLSGWLAAAAYAVATVAVALWPPFTSHYAARTVGVQLLCLVTLAALGLSLLLRRRR